ncbi:programmed cell death 8 (apoptosis-inducing factor) [Paragonimus westermani]|uniref:Programmed cell death 8 (Apoptosis-inducing factor) n=1 Tax=Paragonimus westermani TaxID=34504 RepID=A0A5J4NA25_9TREM|nr:programmed cell death 8 (apoptosis-inducing factor) [Paragonimus westermani]
MYSLLNFQKFTPLHVLAIRSSSFSKSTSITFTCDWSNGRFFVDRRNINVWRRVCSKPFVISRFYATKHQDAPNNTHRSILLPTIGIAMVVGLVFGMRWYMNQTPDVERLRADARRYLNIKPPANTHNDVADRSSGLKEAAVASSSVPETTAKIPLQNSLNENHNASFSKQVGEVTELTEGQSEKASGSPTLDESLSSDFHPLVYIDPSKVGFPQHVRYLVIGAGTAGIAAARAIRASDAKSQILMIAGGCGPDSSAEPGIAETAFMEPPPYLRPPLSKELWRRNKPRESKILQTDGDVRRHSWLYYEAESFFLKPEDLLAAEYGGVALLRGDPVVMLQPDSHTAVLASGRSVTYDRCLIATGASPRRLKQLEVCNKTGQNLFETGLISYFRTLADYKRLREQVDKYRELGGKVAVVGGGFLGSELAVSLLKNPQLSEGSSKSDDPSNVNLAPCSLSVMHIFRESFPMGHILPPCLASATARFETAKGAELWPSSEVVSLSIVPPVSSSTMSEKISNTQPPSPHVQDITTNQPPRQRVRLRIRRNGVDGTQVEEVDVDHVVCAIGVEPNTNLAHSAGLELDLENGGFLVNAEFESRAGVFVAGDAASYWDPVLGTRRRVEHLNFAEATGTLAGKNMAASLSSSSTQHEPLRYQYQSSLWSSLGPSLTWDAVGDVDSRRLLTRSFFLSGNSNSLPSSDPKLPIPESEFGHLDRGVTFYLTPKDKRLVGILLWNLPEDLYTEEEYVVPSRLNIARSILADGRLIGTTSSSDAQSSCDLEAEELRHLASLFDLSGELERDVSEIKAYAELKKQELKESGNGSDLPDDVPIQTTNQ